MAEVGEGTLAIVVTFALAILGYIGVTAMVAVTSHGRLPLRVWRVIAGVIVVHVLMVWHFRYGWEFTLSVRNGYVGFALFHLALALILVSTAVGQRWAEILIHVVFVIVTAGALGATFRYDVVAIYQIPVIVCALVGAGNLVWRYAFKAPGLT